jgi:hypothetical protein
MVDLWDNPHLGTVLRHFHAAGKPIAAVCHAPIALLSAAEAPAQPAQAYPAMEPAGPAAPQLPVGGGRGRKAWPFSGYRMCCYRCVFGVCHDPVRDVGHGVHASALDMECKCIGHGVHARAVLQAVCIFSWQRLLP